MTQKITTSHNKDSDHDDVDHDDNDHITMIMMTYEDNSMESPKDEFLQAKTQVTRKSKIVHDPFCCNAIAMTGGRFPYQGHKCRQKT